jgi:TELO2-interacting protein 2
MLSEMVGHLERQPLNREPRLAWLTLVGPVFDAMGLFLLAHFRRVFSLFFQWMHVDDDKTVLLVRSMYRLCM